MTSQPTFRQVDIGANEYVEPSGKWMLERSFTEGPRGGRRTSWVLWAATDTGWKWVCEESRLSDLWKWIVVEGLVS